MQEKRRLKTRKFVCRGCRQTVVIEQCPPSQRYCTDCQRRQEPKRKAKKLSAIAEINARARAAGMTYGRYVMAIEKEKGAKDERD